MNKRDSKLSTEKLKEELLQLTKANEDIVRKVLENQGTDTSKIRIIDRSKYLVEFIPDAISKLQDKYGSDIDLSKPEMEDEIRKLIEKKFHESIGTPKKWNAYYLLQHCKLPGEIIITENVKVVPFVEWPCEDYFTIMRKLTGGRGPMASSLSEQNFEDGEKNIKKTFGEKNPTGIIIFNDINANNEKDAYNKTVNFAKHVATTLSVLTNSNMEIAIWLLEGKTKGINLIYPHIFFWHYNPTSCDPKTLEDVTRCILRKIPKNYLVQLALKYEKDAIWDSEERFRMLKRWSALEYIAEEYTKSIKPLLSNDDKKKIVSFIIDEVLDERSPEVLQKIQSNVGNMNRKNAKDKIRDLLDYCGYILQNVNENNDVLDVIYQHRNCITHSGGCYKDKPEIDKCDGPAYCRGSDFSIGDLNRELSRMLKAYIGKIAHVTFEYSEEIPSDK